MKQIADMSVASMDSPGLRDVVIMLTTHRITHIARQVFTAFLALSNFMFASL